MLADTANAAAPGAPGAALQQTAVSHAPGQSPGVALAMSLAARLPHVRFEVFEHSWPEADAGRALLRLAGLADRVGVHHRDALECTSVQAALEATALVLIVPPRP